MNEEIMLAAGFKDEVELVKQYRCPFCKKEVGKFKDYLSEREFKISGLCQSCQDKTFG